MLALFAASVIVSNDAEAAGARGATGPIPDTAKAAPTSGQVMRVALVTAIIGVAAITAAEARGGGGSSSSGGSHSTSGYVKGNGTYVAPSRATNPNGTKADNYTTKGNVNPYTGAAGTKNP